MPIIDETLANQGRPIAQRPNYAAIFFVNECIVEIKGDSIEKFWEKEWYAAIYKLIEEWYHERYGNLIFDREKPSAKGIVQLFSTPFLLTIPLIISEVEVPGETAWLIFPNTLLPNEVSLDWITPRPNFDHLSQEELKLLREKTDVVAISRRSINLKIMSAEFASEPLRLLASSIPAHLDKAVDDILSDRKGQISIAFWEMHLAIEKVMKLFLRQKNLIPINTHNFDKLRNSIEPQSLSNKLEKLFSLCPGEKDAIKYRYGEIQEVNTKEAIAYFHTALEIITLYVSHLETKVTMNNFRVLLKLPPWKSA